jgi:hypothetical protein
MIFSKRTWRSLSRYTVHISCQRVRDAGKSRETYRTNIGVCVSTVSSLAVGDYLTPVAEYHRFPPDWHPCSNTLPPGFATRVHDDCIVCGP